MNVVHKALCTFGTVSEEQNLLSYFHCLWPASSRVWVALGTHAFFFNLEFSVLTSLKHSEGSLTKAILNTVLERIFKNRCLAKLPNVLVLQTSLIQFCSSRKV